MSSGSPAESRSIKPSAPPRPRARLPTAASTAATASTHPAQATHAGSRDPGLGRFQKPLFANTMYSLLFDLFCPKIRGLSVMNED